MDIFLNNGWVEFFETGLFSILHLVTQPQITMLSDLTHFIPFSLCFMEPLLCVKELPEY